MARPTIIAHSAQTLAQEIQQLSQSRQELDGKEMLAWSKKIEGIMREHTIAALNEAIKVLQSGIVPSRGIKSDFSDGYEAACKNAIVELQGIRKEYEDRMR